MRSAGRLAGPGAAEAARCSPCFDEIAAGGSQGQRVAGPLRSRIELETKVHPKVRNHEEGPSILKGDADAIIKRDGRVGWHSVL